MKQTLLALLLPLSLFSATTENLFPNPGFETWNKEKNLPGNLEWQWILPPKDVPFAVFEQSEQEKHSGKYSLLLEDRNNGKSNQSLVFPLSRSIAHGAAGKILRFSAWCKQISATTVKCVGIGSIFREAGGKIQHYHSRIDAPGETDWCFLETKILVPPNTDFIRLSFDCAAGWGRCAKAYFDDVSVTLEDPEKKRETPILKLPESAVKKGETIPPIQSTGKYLELYPALPRGWNVKCWGGIFCNKPLKTTPELEINVPPKTGKHAGVIIMTDAMNRTFDLSEISPDQVKLSFVLNRNTALQVKVGNTGITFEHGMKRQNGTYLYEALLSCFGKGPFQKFDGITIQFKKDLPPGILKISDIGLHSLIPAQAPKMNFMPEELRAFLESYGKQDVWEKDDNIRPQIQNGTFYIKGKPIFYLGPWIYNRLTTDWGQGKNPLNLQHPGYTTPPSKETFDFMGFNSTQISAAWTLPAHAAFGLPVPHNLKAKTDEIGQFFKGFKGMPLVMDFAFAETDSLKQDDPVKYKELEQRNSHWHEFIPLCPEHPEGDRFYTEYLKGGVKSALRNNGNVMVYELFNESSYFCSCVYNAREFAKRMEKQYGTINKANNTWGTIFDSFHDLAAQTDFHQFRGLWADYCKFMSMRYVEILRKQKTIIRSIDKRPNVYFTEQISGGNLYTEVGSGMDYRDIAKELDIVTYEGGVPYGQRLNPAEKEGMEAIVFSRAAIIWFYSAFFEALAKGKKPVLNNEHYCTREELGIRVPSRREDMITSLWGEVMRGVSGNFSYSWDKRSWEWRTFEQAKQNVLHPSYKGASFLNPYSWPPEQLDCFKKFNSELEPLQDKILPFPRTKPATVALFYSYPTLRMLSFHRFDFRKRVTGWFAALCEKQYPLRIVFEEDLAAGLPEEIDALVIPCSVYATPESVKSIEKFIAAGKTVIAGTDSFSFDEHGRTLNPLKGKMIRLDPDSASSLKQLPEILKQNGVRRYAELTPADGKALTGARVDIIDRDNFKLLHTAAMDDLAHRFVKLRIFLDPLDSGHYYLTDYINKRTYTNTKGETWNTVSLNNGLKLVLPPQERVLLLLTTERPIGTTFFEANTTETLLNEAREKEAPRMKKYLEGVNTLQSGYLMKRKINGVRREKCQYVELSNKVNMAFRDEIAGDGKGGWFDQGSNDFGCMPLGDQIFADVPFRIIDPEKNGGRSVMILYGTPKEIFPKEILAIPVGCKAAKIYFLHTVGWDEKAGTRVLTYRIHYTDGSNLEVPVRMSHEIGPWWGTPELSEAKIAVEGTNVLASKINMQCMAWKNPHSEKTVASIDVISGKTGAVPAIAAITIERP